MAKHLLSLFKVCRRCVYASVCVTVHLFEYSAGGLCHSIINLAACYTEMVPLYQPLWLAQAP